MEQADIIAVLSSLIKPENTTTEDVFYNAGVIACIDKIEKLALKKSLENRVDSEAKKRV